MKLMKHITIALVLCAIPAMAFGQNVECDDCTHDVSVYMGEGGLIAEADDAEEVTYVASCGGVTRTGELEANDDGMVSMLFTMDNGLACHDDDEDNRLQLGPVTDGGWFWITDADNSAVGSLVAHDVQENETVDIVSAGDGVKMTMGRGAVYLKETATGRVGILPNILPEMPAADAEICGPRRDDDWPYPYNEEMTKSCMLGGGKTKIRLIGPGQYNSRGMITTGMVTRPTTGHITVNADLWVDETGSYSTNTDGDGTTGPSGGPTFVAMRKGWIGKTDRGQSDHNANWLTATFLVSLDSGDPQEGDAGGAGVWVTDTAVDDAATTNFDESDLSDGADNGTNSTPPGQATIRINASGSYCPADPKEKQHTATINIIAVPGANQVHPAVATGRAAGFTSSALATVGAITQLRVVCAPRSASSSHQGQELVPENPFPTRE